MSAQLLVLYPQRTDAAAFERSYKEQHLPYAGPRLAKAGATSVVSKRLATPGGATPFHAVSFVTFPSLATLQACAASQGGQEALAHAASISSGGSPTILVTTDDLS
jgi:uncharacterized protein (TIGR02118 family)